MVTAAGAVTFLHGPPGTPLGTGGREFRTEEVRLEPGSLLVLYTDGLIESRDRDLDEGMAGLAGALRGAGEPLEALCDTILAALLPEAPQDDVAVLLARTL